MISVMPFFRFPDHGVKRQEAWEQIQSKTLYKDQTFCGKQDFTKFMVK